VGKIAALLQAFGLSVGSCGLANVLQCAVGFFFCSKSLCGINLHYLCKPISGQDTFSFLRGEEKKTK